MCCQRLLANRSVIKICLGFLILCKLESEGKQKDSIVIVVSLLNALIRDQLQKLKDCMNVCVLKSKAPVSQLVNADDT